MRPNGELRIEKKLGPQATNKSMERSVRPKSSGKRQRESQPKQGARPARSRHHRRKARHAERTEKCFPQGAKVSAGSRIHGSVRLIDVMRTGRL